MARGRRNGGCARNMRPHRADMPAHHNAERDGLFQIDIDRHAAGVPQARREATTVLALRCRRAPTYLRKHARSRLNCCAIELQQTKALVRLQPVASISFGPRFDPDRIAWELYAPSPQQ